MTQKESLNLYQSVLLNSFGRNRILNMGKSPGLIGVIRAQLQYFNIAPVQKLYMSFDLTGDRISSLIYRERWEWHMYDSGESFPFHKGFLHVGKRILMLYWHSKRETTKIKKRICTSFRYVWNDINIYAFATLFKTKDWTKTHTQLFLIFVVTYLRSSIYLFISFIKGPLRYLESDACVLTCKLESISD